jgi:uncharacterized protein YqjF (DUF2071 family)
MMMIIVSKAVSLTEDAHAAEADEGQGDEEHHKASKCHLQRIEVFAASENSVPVHVFLVTASILVPDVQKMSFLKGSFSQQKGKSPTNMNKDIFLTAEWRKLIMANYIVDPAILQKYVPALTEIDLWEGKCYVSLVAFMFNNTRIRNYSIPFHKNFEEVNLRFYVRYKEENTWKRGVVFIREFVPLPFVTLVANTLYDEKYMTLAMSHDWKITPEKLSISYQWNKKRRHSVEVQAVNDPLLIDEGSKQEFITQHFWGYSRKKNYTSEYRVAHELWKSYHVLQYKVDVDFSNCYGPEFAFLNEAEPESVFLVEGSGIEVYRDRKIFL